MPDEKIQEQKPRKLTAREQRFLAEYTKCNNGAEAARRAGYSVNSARQIATVILSKDYIQEAIRSYWRENHMSVEEAVQRLADMARADLADVFDITSVGFSVDLQQAKERGATKLIKKIKQTTITKIGKKQDDDDEERVIIEVELHDPQTAIDKILRTQGAYKDIENTGKLAEAILKKVAIDTDKIG